MYEVIFTKAAEKQLKKIPNKDQSAIISKLESLSGNPKPAKAKALQGKLAPYHRVRCGNYRVIYAIEDKKLLIIVMKIGHLCILGPQTLSPIAGQVK